MQEYQEINIIKTLKIIKREKSLLFCNFITISVLLTIVSFVIPQEYTSTASILPPENTLDPLLYGFSGIGSGAISSINLALSGGSVISDLWVDILKSRTVYLAVVDNLNLWEIWDLETKFDAITKMTEVTSVTVNPVGVIQISVTTTDSVLSRDIAYQLINNLELLNQKLLIQNATNRRIFLEKRVEEVKDSMNIIEENIVDFNSSHGLIDIEIEGEPIIQALATLKVQEIILESELAGYSSELTSIHPQRRSIESRLNSIKSRINQIESEGGLGYGLGFSVPLESIPELSMQYARLKLDYMVQTTVFELIIQEYERAKIAELKDTPTLKVIDWPNVPDVKSFPKKSIFVIIGFALGISVGVLLIVIKDKFINESRNRYLLSEIYKIFISK